MKNTRNLIFNSFSFYKIRGSIKIYEYRIHEQKTRRCSEFFIPVAIMSSWSILVFSVYLWNEMAKTMGVGGGGVGGIFISDDHRIIYTGSKRNEREIALILHKDKRNCALGV